MEWELNIYRPATARKVGQFQLCVKKPMGRKGRFLTPQPQIIFCPWAEGASWLILITYFFA